MLRNVIERIMAATPGTSFSSRHVLSYSVSQQAHTTVAVAWKVVEHQLPFSLASFLQGHLELCYSVSMSIRGYGPAFERPLPYNVLSSDCPSRQVLDLIADKWTALIFALLEEQPTRYNELHRRIEGISQKMLTQTLRALEANGIIERKVTPTVPPAVEYALSPLGETLLPVMVSLRRWAEQHLQEVEQARHEPR